MQEPVEIVSDSPERTRRLGEMLGEALAAGDVVALGGDLGAGKTVLTRGVVSGLGGDEGAVRSPTFTLVVRHEGGRTPLVHVDAYRLDGPEALVDLGIEDVLDPGAAAVIEWAPRVAGALPEDRLEAWIGHAGPRRRRLRFEARGPRSEALLERFRRALEKG